MTIIVLKYSAAFIVGWLYAISAETK